MLSKLFILGRPGSGKSCAARYIEAFIKIRDGSSFRINDYGFLREKSITEPTRFHQIDKGFEVLDPIVLDEVLEVVNNQALIYCKNEKLDLLIIEFARQDYSKALQIFGKIFVQDAYFLFIDADLATCFERIQNRVANPQSSDDTFISKKTLEEFYYTDNRLYMSVGLTTEFGLYNWQVRYIDNMGSIKKLEEKVVDFVEFILNKNLGKLPQTESMQIVLKPEITK